MRRTCMLMVALGLVGFALAGCSDTPEDEGPPGVDPRDLAGRYSGIFPCDGCPGIPTRLWLLPERVGIFSQDHPDTGPVSSLGLWRWNRETNRIDFIGEGPVRVFEPAPDADLLMQVPSQLEHRLSAAPGHGNYDGTITLEGGLLPGADGATLTECVTGIRIPVSRGGDYATFARQYRSAGQPGQSVHVSFAGRFAWTPGGSIASLTIERFGSIRTGERC